MEIDWNAAWATICHADLIVRRQIKELDLGEWNIALLAQNFPPRIEISCNLLPSDKRRALIPGTDHAVNVTDEELRQVSVPVGKIADDLGLRAKRWRSVTDRVLFVLKPDYKLYEKGDRDD